MLQILKYNKLENLLKDEGYVVVPFLNDDKVNELKSFFTKNHPDNIPGFYASAHAQDIDFRNKMNDKIKEIYQDSIQEYFINHEALGGSFVVKTNTQKERLHPHQDWNIVDETKYRSFNIWVPLIDLNEKNGAIRVLPKSHLWGLNFRGPNIPDENGEKLNQFWEEMTTLNMKAGEALIYDHRLYHASYPNQTDEYRLATVFGIKPKEADMFYYFGNNGNIDMYRSNVEFFMKGNIQEGPQVLEKIETITNSSIKNTHNVNWLDKILYMFKIKS